MAIGSGLGAQLAVAAETTYGTYVAPTRAIEFTKESLVWRKTTAQSAGIAAGRLMDLASRRVVTTADAGGTVDMEVVGKGMGLILQALMGTTVTPEQQDTTTAYLQHHVLADTAGKSLTVQKGVPLTTGSVTRKNFTGCKITSAEFTCEVGGMLTVSIEFDAKDCSESQTLVVASYPLTAPVHFGQMGLLLGDFGDEAAADGIRKVSIKVERPQATDRYYAGAGGRKKEPVTNDKVKITGSIEADYVDVVLDGLHTTDDATSLVWEFIGPVIEDTYTETFRIALPAIKVDSTPPTVDGPAVVKPTWSFTALFDGTNQPYIDYMSTDTTL